MSFFGVQCYIVQRLNPLCNHTNKSRTNLVFETLLKCAVCSLFVHAEIKSCSLFIYARCILVSGLSSGNTRSISPFDRPTVNRKPCESLASNAELKPEPAELTRQPTLLSKFSHPLQRSDFVHAGAHISAVKAKSLTAPRALRTHSWFRIRSWLLHHRAAS